MERSTVLLAGDDRIVRGGVPALLSRERGRRVDLVVLLDLG